MNNDFSFPFGFLDLRFTDGQAHIIKKLNVSSESVKQTLTEVNYSPGLYREFKSDAVEKARFPAFALLFYRHVINHNKVPSAETFLQEVLITYFEQREIQFFNRLDGYDKLQPYDPQSLKGRIYRTYPSLVRDFHFFLLCQESKKFSNVSYSLNDDYFKGLDLTVVYNRKTYVVSLYIATPRADHFKEIKYTRHEYGKNEIVLRLEMDKLQKVKNLYLPDQAVVSLLIAEIEKIEHEKR